MRIQEVMKQTGLSKRSIHFYIGQHLIRPSINPVNGYTDFSPWDVKRLLVIRKLRFLDFSIADIRSMLTCHNTAYYFLHLHKKRLKHKQKLIINQLESLDSLLEAVPINLSADQLADLIRKSTLTRSPQSDRAYEPHDAHLVCLFLFNIFLADLPLTEYRKYLWEKIIKNASKPDHKYFSQIGSYMFSLTSTQIESCFIWQDVHSDKIARLTPDDHNIYMEEMVANIHILLDSPFLVKQWKKLYHSYLHPSTAIFASDISHLMQEMSPKFVSYKKNINACCTMLYQRLYSDLSHIRVRIEKELSGYISLTGDDHGELETLASFTYIEHTAAQWE